MATETTTIVDTPRGEPFYLHALLGAVVTVVTTAIPFSPLLGGFVAGYLQGETDRGTRVGVLAGVFAALPLVLAFFVLFTVMSVGSLTTGEFAGPAFVVLLVGGILLFAALYIVGLSAVGGYLGASYATSRAEKRGAEPLDPQQTTLDEATAPRDAEH